MSDSNSDTQDRPSTRRLFLTGTVMGAADLVPGVSGGTMALVMGIYKEFISALASFDWDVIRSMVKLKWSGIRAAHWWLVLPLAAGMITAFVLLSGPILTVLNHPTQRIWLFAGFFGLVLGSAFILLKRLRHTALTIALVIAGAATAFIIIQLAPIEGSGSSLSLFLSGTIAVSAMVLPGISGSFMLLILGEYENIIGGIRELEPNTFLAFGSGAAIGLFAFVRLLRMSLRKWHDPVMAMLGGFLIGSLWKLWPWRLCTSVLAEVCLNEGLIAPPNTNHFLIAAAVAALGFAVVLGADYWQAAGS